MRKIVIVGGVAGGASAAARLRRLNETDHITLVERGPHVSFANCGLPYYIGDEITDREKLLIQTPELMEARMNIHVMTETEALKIDRDQQQLLVKAGQEEQVLDYDILILSTGAKPIEIPVKGKEKNHVFTLRNIPDMDHIKNYINEHHVKTAAVVGGGFIGLEMVENLRALGIEVSLLELGNQVMPGLDFDMAVQLHEHLIQQGVDLRLQQSLVHIDEDTVTTSTEETIQADMVIMAVGVLPESTLAEAAGLELGVKKAVRTNDVFQTSDSSIYAIGDVSEVTHKISEVETHIPLAWIANRQGRLLADHLNGKTIEPLQPIGTAIAKVFDLTVANTGLNEKQLKQLGKPYHVIHVSGQSHATYYPGATPMTIKVIFSPEGQIYGAQIVGRQGVDKRIDLIASAMTFNQKVTDLQKIEIAYAPPYSSAKDPVNMAGYIAENVLNDDMQMIQYDEVASAAQLIDVREPIEYDMGTIGEAQNIPLGSLRERLNKLDRTQPVTVFCQVGQRGYNAARILKNHGFDVINLDGGYKLYKQMNVKQPVEKKVNKEVKKEIPTVKTDRRFIEASGMQCPGPILKVKENIDDMQEGEQLEIHVTDFGFCTDIDAWAKATGNTVISNQTEGGKVKAVVQKGNSLPINVMNDSAGHQLVETKNGATMVVFSGDLDKALASFIIATGAASYGKEVTMFFTFWGLNVIKQPGVKVTKQGLDRAFGKMMPKHAGKLPISKMNMAGAGARMIRHVMNKKKVDSLETMIEKAQSMGVKMVACTMSMDIMAITKEELIDGVEYGGVATYLGDTEKANLNLFI
ncbi:pyridine nucleotide-disulfide oxidoreductase [Macrococcus hajekii]|uniref:Pyridine nucleotide-disulfide oxidoreductase n=1 Tax=Macrococcus hajekii TaxID=198482 RepID=A0A4R6BK53_9STAP|nr:FAD-dependent oxidoreductase [Macrococcus hajekii]TDM01996.1 pyridine nucleotide-disulfide oxidoreductase [Macrococcus hajekii]GGB09168.1 pyridine nucleotide-disulfide oxidoreductase [Macrococcus hajekii]